MPSDLQIIWRPLEGWPGPMTAQTDRKSGSQFRMARDKTLRLLKDELRKLESSVVVIATAHSERDISVTTGSPRADRSPAHPGLMIAADTKYGSLKWTCDQFRDYWDNLHAIALTLERLRLADLYGVTKRGEQYSGWKMLPGPITATQSGAVMTMEDAARFVSKCTPQVTRRTR